MVSIDLSKEELAIIVKALKVTTICAGGGGPNAYCVKLENLHNKMEAVLNATKEGQQQDSYESKHQAPDKRRQSPECGYSYRLLQSR